MIKKKPLLFGCALACSPVFFAQSSFTTPAQQNIEKQTIQLAATIVHKFQNFALLHETKESFLKFLNQQDPKTTEQRNLLADAIKNFNKNNIRQKCDFFKKLKKRCEAKGEKFRCVDTFQLLTDQEIKRNEVVKIGQTIKSMKYRYEFKKDKNGKIQFDKNSKALMKRILTIEISK